MDSFSFMNNNTFILTKLVYTLSVFIECIGQSGSQESILMCKSLINYIWILRFFQKSEVRKACLFALTRVFLISLPPYFVIHDFFNDVVEMQAWLEGTFIF
jgi:hypothetical protein